MKKTVHSKHQKNGAQLCWSVCRSQFCWQYTSSLCCCLWLWFADMELQEAEIHVLLPFTEMSFQVQEHGEVNRFPQKTTLSPMQPVLLTCNRRVTAVNHCHPVRSFSGLACWVKALGAPKSFSCSVYCKAFQFSNLDLQFNWTLGPVASAKWSDIWVALPSSVTAVLVVMDRRAPSLLVQLSIKSVDHVISAWTLTSALVPDSTPLKQLLMTKSLIVQGSVSHTGKTCWQKYTNIFQDSFVFCWPSSLIGPRCLPPLKTVKESTTEPECIWNPSICEPGSCTSFMLWLSLHLPLTGPHWTP